MFHIRGGPCPVEDFRTGGHRMDAGAVSHVGKGTAADAGTYGHDYS